MRSIFRILTLAVLVVGGCSRQREKDKIPTIAYLTSAIIPDRAKRCDIARSFFNAGAQIKPVEAQFVYVQMLEGRKSSRPKSTEFYARVELDSERMQALAQTLRPMSQAPAYATPVPRPEWWAPPDQFGQLSFFSPTDVLAFDSGFVALAPEGDALLIYSHNP